MSSADRQKVSRGDEKLNVFARIGTLLVDRPSVVTILLCVVVATHVFVATRVEVLNIAYALSVTKASDPRDILTSLSLGVASVASLVGGFAGVVVVFGLGSENDRFRLLRRAGGRKLRASWISVVLSSFTAAFGAVAAAVTVVAFSMEVGMWVLEACILIAAHAALRLTALLGGLAQIVDSSDRDAAKKSSEISAKSVVPDD